MRPMVGYYVHHHGTGHRHRYERIRRMVDDRIEVVPVSQIPLANGLRLTPDAPTTGGDPTAGGVLHWAPVPSTDLAERSNSFLQWVVANRPAGLVVDVSVEAALLGRLAGLPTVVVRQHGDRFDVAHEIAYRSARRLLAPFPATLEHRTTPRWIIDKTSYAGLIATPPTVTRPPRDRPQRDRPQCDDIVVLWGTGGGRVPSAFLIRLARIAGDQRVWCVGRSECFDHPDDPRIVDAGWVDELSGFLTDRPVVVASAGNNVVADVAALRCPLVAIPQLRPFDEQQRHAESLDATGVAAVASIDDNELELRAALESARDRREPLAALGSCGGARTAATIVMSELIGVDA